MQGFGLGFRGFAAAAAAQPMPVEEEDEGERFQPLVGWHTTHHLARVDHARGQLLLS